MSKNIDEINKQKKILKKLLNMHPLSKEEIITFSYNCKEMSKISYWSFKRPKFHAKCKEISKIHGVSFLDFGTMIICFEKLPLVTNNNFDDFLLTEDEIIQREINENQKIKKLEEARLKEEDRLKKLKVKQSNVLAELDKDGNGELDTIEVKDDFDRLVKKHQSKIIETDRSYIQHFVKISNYQKQKRKNLQSIFESISKTKNQKELSSQVELLKEQIHSYELLLFHSLNMVTSLVEDDMFTFYEIYESFDKLEIFNSNHENEVSKRLKNIEGGIGKLIASIRQLEANIIDELGYLNYVTQDSYNQLSNNVTRELESINSSINTNTLLNGINAYQTYKLRVGK